MLKWHRTIWLVYAHLAIGLHSDFYLTWSQQRLRRDLHALTWICVLLLVDLGKLNRKHQSSNISILDEYFEQPWCSAIPKFRLILCHLLDLGLLVPQPVLDSNCPPQLFDCSYFTILWECDEQCSIVQILVEMRVDQRSSHHQLIHW